MYGLLVFRRTCIPELVHPGLVGREDKTETLPFIYISTSKHLYTSSHGDVYLVHCVDPDSHTTSIGRRLYVQAYGYT